MEEVTPQTVSQSTSVWRPKRKAGVFVRRESTNIGSIVYGNDVFMVNHTGLAVFEQVDGRFGVNS